MSGPAEPSDARRVLITFAGPEGRYYKNELLVPLKAYGWHALHDEKLEAGDWAPQLEAWLASCDAAIALVDNHYLQGFSKDVEIPRLLERSIRGDIAFIPILLQDVGRILHELTFSVTDIAGLSHQRSLTSMTWVPSRPVGKQQQKGFGAPPLLEDLTDTNRRQIYYNDAMSLLLDFFNRQGLGGRDPGVGNDDIPPDLDAVVRAFTHASRHVLNCSSEIQGEWIERPELDPLYEKLRGESMSTFALLGDAGSGKSAAMARLALEFDKRPDWSVLAIKC